MSLLGLYYKLQLAWGFSVRYPFASSFQLAPVVPPPSSVIGSIIEPLALELGIKEVVKLNGMLCSPVYAFKDAFKAAALNLSPDSESGLVVKGELTRLNQRFYVGEKYDWFTVQAVSSAYGPGALLEMFAVIDTKELIEKYREVTGKSLSETELEDVLNRIVPRRIGSKEGFVFVKEKILEAVEKCENCETRFYAPEDLWVEKPERHIAIDLWELTESSACLANRQRGSSLRVKFRRYLVPSGSLSTPFMLTPPHRENLGLVKSGYCIRDLCVGEIPWQ